MPTSTSTGSGGCGNSTTSSCSSSSSTADKNGHHHQNHNNPACPTIDTGDPNWQATKSTVRERNAAMFNNELIADIKFIVGSDG